ncbi:hypothetical protein RB195_021326 [Necator americanus]|uniref:mannose-6-phosphate isomerase n=1 Tax=Necator americanus TaxID=51031 RepID=A0ABR1EAG7_NECAM
MDGEDEQLSSKISEQPQPKHDFWDNIYTSEPRNYAVTVYSLGLIIVIGVVTGYLVQIVRLPSLLGMLLTGILLRNFAGSIITTNVIKEWSVVLRRTAFIVILLRGGLSLDANAIRRLKGACLRLSVIPCTVEIISVTLASKIIFGMDVFFGIALGAVLAAVSPAVVIPALLDASKGGYGVRAGVPSLVIAAASLDDVYAITIFSLILSLTFPSSGASPLLTILGAPAEVFCGVFFGSVMGFLLHFIPRKDVQNLHLVRLALLFTFSLAFLLGTTKLRVDGAGAIGVLVAAFVAGHAWKKEGELPEEDYLAIMWHHFFQPLLFGLIGLELSFEMISLRTMLLGVVVLTIGLIFRFIASFFAVFGSGLAMRERLFVAVAWLPKATVQAALAPIVLETAQSRSSSSPYYIQNGIFILTMAILSILITAPLGALAIRLATPVLLKNDKKSAERLQTNDVLLMYKLVCAVQNYSWGKPGSCSTVAALVKQGHHRDYVDDEKPYAEFWMGVHPNGPAKIAETSEDLSNRIKNHPEIVADHEEGTLQFLFKVLSVDKALSVQSHPTKEEAIALHAKDPLHYPDPNHKPEMAIALTDFELLCGFRPAKEIYENLKGAPEVLHLVGDAVQLKDLLGNESTAKIALKKIFTKIWSSASEDIAEAVQKFVSRIKQEPQNKTTDLVIRLDGEFPGGDVGVFAPILLNHFTLKPGQATFLGPNQPHAYLLGDCVECMACSDNTIRAGLTPKFKDIKTLCANLTYAMSGPPIFPSKVVGPGIELYAPPVPEFAVQAVKANATHFTNEKASSIVVVVTGTAHFKAGSIKMDVQRGDVVFFCATTHDVEIMNASKDFVCYRAFTPRR